MRTVNVAGYLATEIDRSFIAMMAALKDATLVEEINLDGLCKAVNEYGYELAPGYTFSDRIEDIGAAGLLSDGRIIVSDVEVKGGGDTFNSGELIVKHFILAPK